MIYSFLSYDLEFPDGQLTLVPAMSAIAEEVSFAPKPKPKPKPKPLIGKHVSLHGAYQVMADNLLGEFVIEPVSN